MDPLLERIGQLRSQGDHVEALRHWWDLNRAFRLSHLSPDLQNLQEPIASACRQLVEQAGQRQSAVQWLRACVANWNPPPALIDNDDDELRDHRSQVTFAYFRCAASAISLSEGGTGIVPEDVQAAAKLGELQNAFLADLTHTLSTGQPRPASAPAQQVTPLLIDKTVGDVGVVAWLKLELITDGTGSLYPHPDMGFVWRDDSFRQAEQNAWQATRQDLGIADQTLNFDIRWSLGRVDKKRFHPVLTGNSAGLAFALGILRLLAGRPEVRHKAGDQANP